MTFEFISELTRAAARLSMLFFAAAFIYEAFRSGRSLTRRLWQGFAALQTLYFICLIIYHFVILEWPQIDIINGLLSVGTIMYCVVLWYIWDNEAEKDRLFAPPFASYILALLFMALPISRILPPETDAPIYHVMLHAMGAVILIRIALDIRAALRRRAASK